MTEQEIQARVKARLKEEGIDTDEGSSEKPAAKPVHRAKPPVTLEQAGIDQNAATPSSEDKGQGEPSAVDPLDQAQEELQAETNKKNENDSTLQKGVAAGAGAAAGLAARYKGMELGKGMLSPGENVFTPSGNKSEQISQTYKNISDEMKARQAAMEKIDEQIRQITRNPKATSHDLTPEQIERIFQGGEGSTLGTTGAQRGFGYQGEQQRRARVQADTERNVRGLNPNLSDPIVSAGQLVPLRSGIQVPPSVAAETAQAELLAQQNAQKANLEAERQTHENLLKENQKNLNATVKGAKRSGYVTGGAKLGMGALGGALTGLDALNAYRVYEANKQDPTKNRPLDWTDYMALGGGPLAMFGKKILGPIGLGMQIPYAVRHRDEVARGMTMSDINPTVYSGTEATDPAFPQLQPGFQQPKLPPKGSSFWDFMKATP
jgi:hypothetical protein